MMLNTFAHPAGVGSPPPAPWHYKLDIGTINLANPGSNSKLHGSGITFYSNVPGSSLGAFSIISPTFEKADTSLPDFTRPEAQYFTSPLPSFWDGWDFWLEGSWAIPAVAIRVDLAINFHLTLNDPDPEYAVVTAYTHPAAPNPLPLPVGGTDWTNLTTHQNNAMNEYIFVNYRVAHSSLLGTISDAVFYIKDGRQ